MACMKDYLIWCEEKMEAECPWLPWSVIERFCTETDLQKRPGYSITDYVKSEKNKIYEEYMCASPMTDGEEMRCFFEDLND